MNDPAPFRLSKERETSSIPKADTDEKWQYPSERQFWQAMRKKGWSHDKEQLRDGDMTTIIAIHNANNEATWREVMRWERLLHPECKTPKLKRFYGNASNYSPKARLANRLLGHELPFDRHDWIVDRCGQKDVRYVIDYYDGGDVDPNTKTFARIDVRPAITDDEALWDRIVMACHTVKKRLLSEMTPSEKRFFARLDIRQAIPNARALWNEVTVACNTTKTRLIKWMESR